MHWFALLPHSKKVFGLNLAADWGPSVGSLHVFYRASIVFLQVLKTLIQRYTDQNNWLL